MHKQQEKSLCFSQSYLCPLAADVISDGHSIYFYLYDVDYERHQLIAHSACWIGNIDDAPLQFDYDHIQQDQQPLLPKHLLHEKHPTCWMEDNFSIVWSKEGDMAAAYYGDEVVCAIPDWANPETFCGYSRYVKEDCAVGFCMDDVEAELGRDFKAARTFWKQEFNGLWQVYHTQYVQALRASFGELKAIYDLHQEQFPSRLLAIFEKADVCYAFTIGMGMFAMPHVGAFYEEKDHYNRTELAIALNKTTFDEEARLQIYNEIAQLCDYPWSNFTCFLDSHTVDLALASNTHCIFVDDDRYPHALALPFKQDHVHLQWLVGIDESEYNLYHLQEDKEGFMNYMATKSNVN